MIVWITTKEPQELTIKDLPSDKRSLVNKGIGLCYKSSIKLNITPEWRGRKNPIGDFIKDVGNGQRWAWEKGYTAANEDWIKRLKGKQ